MTYDKKCGGEKESPSHGFVVTAPFRQGGRFYRAGPSKSTSFCPDRKWRLKPGRWHLPPTGLCFLVIIFECYITNMIINPERKRRCLPVRVILRRWVHFYGNNKKRGFISPVFLLVYHYGYIKLKEREGIQLIFVLGSFLNIIIVKIFIVLLF